MRPPTSARRGFLAVALAAFATLGLTAGTADASYVFKFNKKVTTNTTEAGSGYALELIAHSTDPTKVNFKIWNTGPVGSVITKFFVQDGLLVEAKPTDFMYSNPGIAFKGGSPGGQNLPGGESINPAFEATSALSTLSTGAGDGVNKGEWAQFTYKLQAGYTYNDLVTLANQTYESVRDGNGLPNPHLRFGIHVQGLVDDGSDSFINTGGVYSPGGLIEDVPAPPAVVLAVMGVGLFGFVGRRLRRPAVA